MFAIPRKLKAKAVCIGSKESWTEGKKGKGKEDDARRRGLRNGGRVDRGVNPNSSSIPGSSLGEISALPDARRAARSVLTSCPSSCCLLQPCQVTDERKCLA